MGPELGLKMRMKSRDGFWTLRARGGGHGGPRAAVSRLQTGLTRTGTMGDPRCLLKLWPAILGPLVQRQNDLGGRGDGGSRSEEEEAEAHGSGRGGEGGGGGEGRRERRRTSSACDCKGTRRRASVLAGSVQGRARRTELCPRGGTVSRLTSTAVHVRSSPGRGGSGRCGRRGFVGTRVPVRADADSDR